MTNYVFPPRDLPGRADAWGRAVEQRDAVKTNELTQVSQDLNNSLRAVGGQLAVIGSQIDTLTEQQIALSATISQLSDISDRLVNAGQVFTDSSSTYVNGDAWVPDPPSVTASSMSRRFRVSVGGSAAGSTSFFTFSTTGYPRDRILGGGAAAERDRASAFGGVSSAGSAFKSWIVTMPGTGNYTFTAQGRGSAASSASGALYIFVEPLL